MWKNLSRSRLEGLEEEIIICVQVIIVEPVGAQGLHAHDIGFAEDQIRGRVAEPVSMHGGGEGRAKEAVDRAELRLRLQKDVQARRVGDGGWWG